MERNLSHRHYEKNHFDKIFEQILLLSAPDKKEESILPTLLENWGMHYWGVFFKEYFVYKYKDSIYKQIKNILENQTFYYYQDFDNAILCLLPAYEEMTGKSRQEAITDLFDVDKKPDMAKHHITYFNHFKNLDLIKQYSQLSQDLINLLNHNDNNEYQLNLYEKVSAISDRLSMIVNEDSHNDYFIRVHSRLDEMLNSLDFNDDEKKSLLYIQKSLQQFEIGDPNLIYPPYLNESLLLAISGESFEFPLYEIRDKEYFKTHLGIQKNLESIRDFAAEKVTIALDNEDNILQYQDDWNQELPLNPIIKNEIDNLFHSVKGLNEFIRSNMIASWLEKFDHQNRNNLWTYKDFFAFLRVLPFLYPKNNFQINAFETYTGIMLNHHQPNQDTNMELDQKEHETEIVNIDNTTSETSEKVEIPPILEEYTYLNNELFFIDRLQNSEENRIVYNECMDVSAKLFGLKDGDSFENQLKSAASFDEELFRKLKFAYHTSKGDFNIIGCSYFSEIFAFAEHLIDNKMLNRQGLTENEISALITCRQYFIGQYNHYLENIQNEVLEIYTPLLNVQDFMIKNSSVSPHLFNFRADLEEKLKNLGFEVKHFEFTPPSVEEPIDDLLQRIQDNNTPSYEESDNTDPEYSEPITSNETSAIEAENHETELIEHNETTPSEQNSDSVLAGDDRIRQLEAKIDYLVSALQVFQQQSPNMPLIWRDAQNDIYWVHGQYRFGNYEFTEFLGEVREIVNAVTSYTEEVEEALNKKQDVDKVNWDFLNYLFGTMSKVQTFKFSQTASMLLEWHSLLMFTYQNNIPMNDEIIFINKIVCQTLQENILMPENRTQEDCHFALNLLKRSLKTLEWVNFQSQIQKQIEELSNSSTLSNNNKYQSIMESITALREQNGESYKSANRNHLAISNTLNLLDSSLKQSNLSSLSDIVETMAKDNQKANMKINDNIKRIGWLVQVLANFMGLDVANAWKKYQSKIDDETDNLEPVKKNKKGFFSKLLGK